MKPYLDLTPTQKRILGYLEDQMNTFGKIPSLREAAHDNNVTHAAIAQTIRALEKKGYLKRGGRYSRMLYLLQPEGDTVGPRMTRKVPVIGSIAAGLPLYAQQEWDGHISVDSSLYPDKPLFALKIKGDSMKDAAILNGDFVICEPRQFAENGEIIVALINNEEATVKRFFKRKNSIELRPENKKFKPVSYSFADILIQGKVVGVIRGPNAFL